jgi:hypothetical protein
MTVTAAPATTSITAQLMNDEIGSLDGRMVCHRCRQFILISLDHHYSAVGYATSIKNGLWRLHGIYCPDCRPETDAEEDWCHSWMNKALINVVLRRETDQTPQATEIVILNHNIEVGRPMR